MSKWIEIRLGGPFESATDQLQEALKWRFRDDQGRRLVCLDEIYRGVKPRLITLHKPIHVNDAKDPDQYRDFRSWPAQDHYLSIWDEVYPHMTRLQETGKVAGFWATFLLSVMAAPDEVFAPQIQAFFESVGTELPEARLWTAALDESYPGRVAAIRGLFAGEHTPEVLKRTPFGGFPGARGLISDSSSGLAAYIAPVFLGRMPFVLGLNASRGNGLVLVNFGAPRPGVEDMGYSGLYQLFIPRYMSRARLDIGDVVEPDISAEEIDEALIWWVQQLNALFGVLIDPAQFPAQDGIYSPARHFGTILSLDRLASTITGILAYDLVDQFVRKMLFFDALDLLHGLGFGDYKKTLSLKNARELLNRMTERTPTSVQKVLLNRCSRAVDSLAEMQVGFFIEERISGNLIRVRSGTGWQEIGMEAAVSQYLRLVRNSSHSFLGDIQKPFQLSLLASHTGDIPSSLADLPLLYFMQLLIEPEQTLGSREADR